MIAHYTLTSKQLFKSELLGKIPRSSLTVWTSTGSTGITAQAKQRILQEFDQGRLYLDVELWKGCGPGGFTPGQLCRAACFNPCR